MKQFFIAWQCQPSVHAGTLTVARPYEASQRQWQSLGLEPLWGRSTTQLRSNLFAHLIDLVSRPITEIHFAAPGRNSRTNSARSKSYFLRCFLPSYSVSPKHVLPSGLDVTGAVCRLLAQLYPIFGPACCCGTLQGDRLATCMPVNLIRQWSAALASCHEPDVWQRLCDTFYSLRKRR